jgi:anti-anti-sigma factor
MLHDTPIAVEVDTGPSDNALFCLRASGYLGRGTDRKIIERLSRSNGGQAAGETVVLNLCDVTFIDSAGISSLLAVQQEMSSGGRRIILCNVPPFINQTFDIVGMSRLIPVVEDLERAREIAKS